MCCKLATNNAFQLTKLKRTAQVVRKTDKAVKDKSLITQAMITYKRSATVGQKLTNHKHLSLN